MAERADRLSQRDLLKAARIRTPDERTVGAPPVIPPLETPTPGRPKRPERRRHPLRTAAVAIGTVGTLAVGGIGISSALSNRGHEGRSTNPPATAPSNPGQSPKPTESPKPTPTATETVPVTNPEFARQEAAILASFKDFSNLSDSEIASAMNHDPLTYSGHRVTSLFPYFTYNLKQDHAQSVYDYGILTPAIDVPFVDAADNLSGTAMIELLLQRAPGKHGKYGEIAIPFTVDMFDTKGNSIPQFQSAVGLAVLPNQQGIDLRKRFSWGYTTDEDSPNLIGLDRYGGFRSTLAAHAGHFVSIELGSDAKKGQILGKSFGPLIANNWWYEAVTAYKNGDFARYDALVSKAIVGHQAFSLNTESLSDSWNNGPVPVQKLPHVGSATVFKGSSKVLV